MTKRRSHGTGSVVARGPGRWQVRASAGRDPLTEGRVRITRSVRGTKKQAEQRLREVQSEIDQGIDVVPGKMTVAEWLDRWLVSHRASGRIGASTDERYAGIIRRHLKPTLGKLLLQQVRPAQVEQVKACWLSGDGSTSTRPLRPSTVNQHLVVLHEAFSEAERLQLVARNPVSRMKKLSLGGQTEQRVLDEDEVRGVLEAARGTPVDVVLRLILATGLRIGEVFALRWSDADFDTGALLVQRNARFRTGSGVVMDTLKTKNARRLIELSPKTMILLARQRVANAEVRLAAGKAWLGQDLVFCSSLGTPHIHANQARVLRRVLGSSGVDVPETVGFHTFRHTAATHWIKAGADIYAVSRRLGHADAAFTMNVYGHLLKGMQATAAGAMDHLIAG